MARACIFIWILLMLCVIGKTDSFLFSNSSPPVRITSQEFRHLSQLIINEEQSRHHVENEVTSIEQSVARLEQDLIAKYDANLKQIEEMYNQKLQNLTDTFNEKKKDLDLKVNETRDALERQVNTSGAFSSCNCKIDQQLINMENATRKQFENEHFTLAAHLQNLTDAFTDLLQKYSELKETFDNETTKSQINSTLIDKIHEMKSNVADINQTLTKISMQCPSQMTIDKLSANITRHDNKLANNMVAVVANSAKLANITVDISTLIRNTSLDRATVAQLRQKISYHSAFAVDTPNATTTKGMISFNHEISNIGGHYNQTAGKYKCPYDGIYVFMLHMYKHYTEPFAYCWIRVNGIRLLYADSDLQTRSGFDEASKSGPLHLSQGDIVDVGGCTDMKTISPLTTFTGFLLHAD